MFFDKYSELLSNTIASLNRENVQQLLNMIEETRNSGRHLFLLGNGGSAATASHWVCDFGKGINTKTSKRLKIYSPVDNSAIFSALGNDFGYESTFVEQMKNFLEPGDMVLSFSVSGNSSNLVEAHCYARKIGAKTACIVGNNDGKLIGMSDFVMVVPSKNYGVVEDICIILGHAISQEIHANNINL